MRPGKHLRQMFFPVKNSGSWAHLLAAEIGEESMEAVCLEIQKELSTTECFVWMDKAEVILCEAKGGRLLKKYDIIIKGQFLFKLDDTCCSFFKEYGKKDWKPVTIHHRAIK